MKKFESVPSQVNLPELEEKTTQFWKENKIFEKSVEKDASNGNWTFLDGPPFITGLPHYGSLLSSMPKDLFPRYYTMNGYRVRRVWGWDGHGLPIENKVESKLNIQRKKDIEEKVGVKIFIDECLSYVNQMSSEWEWYIEHIGRWVDFKNAYKTWDTDYMESVMWVFKQMYEKDLIYKGLRVSLFCPHCSTPISNFEIAMDADNYKDVIEAANTYKYQLEDDKDTYFLAWSTTPWNKLATPALAVNPKLDYVKVKQGDENYILAKTTLKILKEEPKYQIIDEFKGSDLVGKKFIPHYDYYKIETGKKAFVIIGGDFVTADEGTGIVTIAAYGEEDLKVMQKENIQIVLHVDDEGVISKDVPKFGGMYYSKANSLINQDLADRGLMYEEKEHTHSVAHCWRCGTRLFYAPKDAWFVNVQKIKPQLFKNNKDINWFPNHFKKGRFARSMEAAPDWNISRNRYWGSPIPVWECESCGERTVPGSIKELEELSGQKITSLHKPDIDEVIVKCLKCGQVAKRVPEVLDSWIEAGSASFAERHFPFEGKEKLDDFFPPDFIAEYTGQVRAWFYVLHVIGTALYDSPAFKNVVVEGVLLGIDGRKMSKNFGNYPDPKMVIEKYGGDALRLYLMGSPIMKGEDMNFSEEGVAEDYRFLLVYWNTYKFFTDYAILENWTSDKKDLSDLTVLDKWILSRLNQVIVDVRKSFDSYDVVSVTSSLKSFVVNDFSTWYIRRSRDRVGPEADKKDRNTALSVMYEVLLTLSKVMAPLVPFITEQMFRNLTGEESVHLQDYPVADKSLIDQKLMNDMTLVRKIVEQVHAKRKEFQIKLRQPLAVLKYKSPNKLDEELESILADEVNVKRVDYKQETGKDLEPELDTNISPELKDEGDARDLIRGVQKLRKEAGLTLSDKTNIEAPAWPKNFEQDILKKTSSVSINVGEVLKVIKV